MKKSLLALALVMMCSTQAFSAEHFPTLRKNLAEYQASGSKTDKEALLAQIARDARSVDLSFDVLLDEMKVNEPMFINTDSYLRYSAYKAQRVNHQVGLAKELISLVKPILLASDASKTKEAEDAYETIYVRHRQLVPPGSRSTPFNESLREVPVVRAQLLFYY